MNRVSIGVDIGKLVDPTAIVITSSEKKPPCICGSWACAGCTEHYYARTVDKMELNTSYTDVAERLRGINRKLRESQKCDIVMFIDATGVGLPIVDMLVSMRVACIPVFFTSGTAQSLSRTESKVTLGKEWMVSRLTGLMQAGLLHLPGPARSRYTDDLRQELKDYEIRANTGSAKFGAFRPGSHDDLVTALGLATQITLHGKVWDLYRGVQRRLFNRVQRRKSISVTPETLRRAKMNETQHDQL